ncbi:hypothetical protein NKJ35_06190 [Mesorhizobium sp. M0136]|uniref:hypothetical protein n=1 Tax=Mesorhizobium sp. M0136 TaxID=2956890 RepID=UPI00333BBC11
MFVYLCSTLGSILAGLEQPYQLDIMRWHAFAIDLLFMVDVLVAIVSYIFTLCVLDNHIRSVEPAVFGWLICLACYEPINTATRAYLNYETGANWKAVIPSPALQVFWGSAVLFCILIFVWSTVSFGLRFSNLTNRGNHYQGTASLHQASGLCFEEPLLVADLRTFPHRRRTR